MRDIKFRAWREQVNRFRFFDISTGFNVENSDVFKSIEQFTGLQDANGVDIYEGDIVGILFTDWPSQPKDDERSLDEYMESLEKVFPICFNKGAFQISGKGYYGNDIGYDDIRCGKHGYIKIIGNIHQNPELIAKGE
tara:strand:- start:43636 stop:44046 length:411 start_codon:yes stop_codon:yes gene_type:complete